MTKKKVSQYKTKKDKLEKQVCMDHSPIVYDTGAPFTSVELTDQQRMNNLIAKYIIVDQTKLASYYYKDNYYSWNDNTEGLYNFDENLGIYWNKIYLIYNDLAAVLIGKKELIYITDQGTFWFAKVRSDLNKHPVLLSIVEDSKKAD